MARQSKCVICKQLFNTEDMVIKSSKKYCKNCFEEHEKEKKFNKKDWDLLFEYICEIYKIDKPTGMIFKQLKDFRSEYDYTDIGMYYTLKYYFDVLENEVLEGSGVGIIPYFYERAKQHYTRVYDIADMVEIFENTEEKIQIKTKRTNKLSDNRKPIPLDKAWGGEED